MHPVLNTQLANALVADRLREAERFRRTRVEWAEQPDAYDAVTVRLAGTGDAEALRRLAQLDGRPAPQRPVLVAEVHGELLAARALDGDGSLADPFHPTAHLAELLELRSAHLRDGFEPGDGRRGGPRRWLRAVLATGRS